VTSRRLLLDASALPATIRRLAEEILDRTAAPRGLVGIRRGGEPLSLALAAAMKERGHVVPVGSVDIALYRDDASSALPDSKIGPSRIDFSVDGADVILVDDVLQTGRTVRAAIDALLDYGRPRRVWLATLLDRGGRELPIAADFVGQTVHVAPTERVLVELDGEARGAWAEPKLKGAR
jgi:pyrimidine operon attenuation protein/uracil phosphoribosyltransferase